ncbi:hypothetical protein MTR67_004994, partial [Solanum verrucosum]
EAVRHKFGELNPWCTNVSTDTYGVGVWKTIRALWPKLEGNLQKRVGDGKRIKFWKDAWKEQSPLMEIFPDLFIVSNNPDGTIYDMWSAQGWNLFFRRLLNDWEIDRVADLLNRIDDFNGTTAEPDTLRWKHNIDGQFSVKRVYKMEERVQCRGQPKIWRNLWNSPSPTKVKCFTWLVVKRACLTQEVLKKKGAIIVSRCFLCNETNETNSHLFLHCTFTAQLWSLFLNITKTSWTMPEHTADLLSCWMKRGGSKSQKKWWRIIPQCIWWTVWRERNGRCYEDRSNSIQKVKWNCIISFYFWCKEVGLEDIDQFVDILRSL